VTAIGDLRARSTIAFVEALRRHGSLTRANLAERTGLSRATVASVFDELEQRGLVSEQRASTDEPRARGRRPTVVRLHPAAGVALGIAIEREQLGIALVDLSLTVLANRRADFELDTPAEALLEIAGDALGDASIAHGPRADRRAAAERLGVS